MNTKFATTKVRGQKIDLYIDTVGKFIAEYDGEQYTANTKDDLIKKLHRATKKPLAIPFCRWEDSRHGEKLGKLRYGMITGVHAANNNLIVKFDDDKSPEQDRSWGTQDYLALNEKEAGIYSAMQKTLFDVQQSINKFEEKYSFSAREAAEEALARLEKEPAK